MSIRHDLGPAGPRSREFRVRLRSALEFMEPGGTVDPVDVGQPIRTSRNTIIYRCRAGSKRWVAKVQLTKPASVVAAEYDMLHDMAGRMHVSGVRSLTPVTLIRDLGVLVTEEENGAPLRTVIHDACVKGGVHWPTAVRAVEAAGRALHGFHETYRASAGPGHNPLISKRYLDFSPRNLLISWPGGLQADPEVVLMDPPEADLWGPGTEDMGVFCYDMARIRFAPTALYRMGFSVKLDHLKARFISSYFGENGEALMRIHQIREAERRRGFQTLKWYAQPWRYSSVLKETLRFCYMGPLTMAYLTHGLRKSYNRVEELLHSK